MNTDKKLQTFLQDPHSYPEPTETVEIRETHISQVFLTEHSAYKIKKPWKLPFLDYSTLELRHEACMAELELNRRFSQDIYRDVVTITQEKRGLAFQGRGPAVEYAVWMRRIPDSCLMDARLRDKTFAAHDKERLVEHLASCYAQAPHVTLDGETYWQRLHGLIEENRTSLYELSLHLDQDPRPWQAMSSRQLLFLQVYRDFLMNRVKEKRVIEGHGDLRPEHIVFEDRVSIIDGIEFNRDLRILDQADELSFLAMECAEMGASELGHELRQRILDQLHDNAPSELLAFYECYRALVRAKVNALKAEQQNPVQRAATLQTIANYQKLAEKAGNRALPPFTFLIAGAMGSGKTTVASAIKQDLGAVHLESDQIRQDIFGRSQETAAYGQGRYTAEARLSIYEKMRDRMLDQLRDGMNVIVDASFSSRSYVQTIVEALQRESRPYLLVHCECSDAEAMARIGRRMQSGASASEARPELYREQKNKGEWTFTDFPHCQVNTESNLAQELKKVYQTVAEVLRKSFEK
jgi:aminoglycoside phosphotransferase family enzyme/predicted kinase